MGNKNEGYLGGIMGDGSRVLSGGGGLKNTSILSLEEAGTQAVEAAPANKLAGTSILDWTDAGSSYGSSTSTAMVKTGDSWDLLSYDISGFTDGFVCIEMFLPADTAHRAGGIGYSNGATLSSVVGSAVGAAGIRRQIGASVIGQVSTAGFSTTNSTFHNYGAHPVVFQLLIECSTGNAWLSYGEAGGATRYWITGQTTRATSFDYNSPLDSSTVITELHAQNYYGGTTSYVNTGSDGTFGGQTSDNDTSEWFWDIPAEIAGSGPTETLTLPQLSWGGITGRSVLTEVSVDTFATLDDTNTPHVVDTANNLSVNFNAGTTHVASTQSVSSGKYYAEFRYYLTQNATAGFVMASVMDGLNPNSYDVAYYGYNGNSYVASRTPVNASYGNAVGDEEIIGVALNADTGYVWFSRNGTWIAGSQNGATSAQIAAEIAAGDTTNAANSGYRLTGPLWFGFGSGSSIERYSAGTANFGQDATFDGQEAPTTTFTDANGLGEFYYEPPAGFVGLYTTTGGSLVNTGIFTLEEIYELTKSN